MRLHRANKNGTYYYYCYFRNRASSKCKAVFLFNQYTKTVTIVEEHNHEPNLELNKSELTKYHLKEITKGANGRKSKYQRPTPGEIVESAGLIVNPDYKENNKRKGKGGQRND